MDIQGVQKYASQPAFSRLVQMCAEFFTLEDREGGSWWEVEGTRWDLLIPEESSRKDEERLREMTAGIIFGWGKGYYGGMSGETKIQYTFTQGWGNLGSWDIVWMLDQGKKDMFSFPEKVCWCLFSLENEHTKNWNQFYTLMNGFFSSGTTEILELRAISSENKENRILHFSMIQSTVCWEVHLWQIRGGEYEVTAIWLNIWK